MELLEDSTIPLHRQVTREPVVWGFYAKTTLTCSQKDDISSKCQWALTQTKQSGFLHLTGTLLKLRIQLFFLTLSVLSLVEDDERVKFLREGPVMNSLKKGYQVLILQFNDFVTD